MWRCGEGSGWQSRAADDGDCDDTDSCASGTGGLETRLENVIDGERGFCGGGGHVGGAVDGGAGAGGRTTSPKSRFQNGRRKGTAKFLGESENLAGNCARI